MPDILQTLIIKAPPGKVFEGITTTEGLDAWWTKTSETDKKINGIYLLNFGPGYIWKAVVTKYLPDTKFELQITEAEKDWIGTKVGFLLNSKNNNTEVNFYHTGWMQANEHYSYSNYCWAMYLRILKRHIETGENVSYEKRLSV